MLIATLHLESNQYVHHVSGQIHQLPVRKSHVRSLYILVSVFLTLVVWIVVIKVDAFFCFVYNRIIILVFPSLYISQLSPLMLITTKKYMNILMGVFFCAIWFLLHTQLYGNIVNRCTPRFGTDGVDLKYTHPSCIMPSAVVHTT